MLTDTAQARKTPSSSYVRDALLHMFLSGPNVCRKNECKNDPHYVQRLRLPYQLEIEILLQQASILLVIQLYRVFF